MAAAQPMPAEESPTARIAYREAVDASEHDPETALRWLRLLVDAPADFAAWNGGVAVLDRVAECAVSRSQRQARVAVLGSYTTNQFTELLRLAAMRYGVWIETYEAGFDQYQQEVLDEGSRLYEFDPDIVVFAVHDRALHLPEVSGDPQRDVTAEADRWEMLWTTVRQRSGASVLQHNFAVRRDRVYGNVAATLPGIRSSMIRTLNRRLGERRDSGVGIVDVASLAAHIGTESWFDDRYWHRSKQAVALAALPALARHTAALLAAQVGLSNKVLVLDLDNTLWGGTIGDDGLDNIVLGSGSADGEAFVAFQRFCKALSERGILLAVCSKNDDHTARLPFREHPAMHLQESDISAFVANWEPKPANLRSIAATLNVGIDSLVFVDDHPGEREVVRQLLPEVEVIPMPTEPADFISAVAGSLLFESTSITKEDRQRTSLYKARAATEQLRATTSSLDGFYRSLEMAAIIEDVSPVDLPRVVQLLGKTNQFNLTTRRHGKEMVQRFMDDPTVVAKSVRLSDRFADHGLISVVIAREDAGTLDIDTWVMSCRVIGRTLERSVLAVLIAEAQRRGMTSIRGTYLPTERNGLVAGLYEELGFELVASDSQESTWIFPVPDEIPHNEFIADGSVT